jgi:uncharacterized phiE125 gp8 family phage protein
LDLAKRHLRIDDNAQDTEVEVWIRTARQQVEKDTELALLTQTVDVSLDEFPYGYDAIVLNVAPIQSITYVKYYDSTGTLQTWANTNYVLDAASIPPRLGLAVSASWPTSLRVFQPGVIRLVAGYTSASLVPDPLLHAMKLLIGCYSRDREPTPVERSTYERLLDPYSIRVF